MAIATRETRSATPTASESAGVDLTAEEVWRQVERASFAVLSYITPVGEPRSSGVVYKVVDKRLYTVVAPESWKARHIAADKHVSLTIPVLRGGVLALLFPIPPATISFHAIAIVHPAGSVKVASLSKDLESLLPPERRDRGVVIELIPEGRFLTYGVGVSLTDMQKPEFARASLAIR